MAVSAQPIQTPPLPGPVRTAVLPTAQEATLPNGLRVIAFQVKSQPKAQSVPLIAAQLIVRSGGSSEDETHAGLANMTSTLLTSGTKTRGALAISQAVDALGARLNAGAGYDASLVSVSATTPTFPAAFDLFADVVLHPAFAAAEVERVRTKSISDLQLGYSSPSFLARLVAGRVAYGASPYAHPLSGTATSLKALTRDDVVAFHANAYRPDNALLVIGGDIAPDAAIALVTRVLGGWTKPATALVAAPVSTPVPARSRVIIIDKPDAGRTAIVAGCASVARLDPNYYAGVVSTAVLSGFSGRLNQEIRVKRGLSYGASAGLGARKDSGVFTAATLVDHTKVVEGTKVVLDTLASLADAPVPAEELAPRKATVTGDFYRGIETIDGIAGTFGDLALNGVPLADIGTFIPHVNAIDAAAIAAFSKKYIAEKPFVVLVGDAAKFAPGIRAAFGDVEVIPFASLDLGAANLKAP
jgi:zinc protease